VSAGSHSSTATERPEVGTTPSGPERPKVADWIAIFKRAARGFLGDDCMGLAQEIAYSSLLAFFPAVIFLVGLLGVLDAYDALKGFIDPITPKAVTGLIDRIQKDSANTGTSWLALLLGGAGATWAASGAMGSVIKAVNRAQNLIETRPFWKVRLTAIVLVIASAVVTGGLLLLIIVGGPLGTAIADWAGLGGVFKTVWNIVRWPAAFAAVVLLFSLVYYLAPNREPRSWKWITPGSVVGAVLWLVLSGLFALYTSFSGSFGRTYGSLASGVILLLWLNYSAWALLFGAELNAEVDHQADIRAAGGENAGLTKQARRSP
jgi:membrane protein